MGARPTVASGQLSSAGDSRTGLWSARAASRWGFQALRGSDCGPSSEPPSYHTNGVANGCGQLNRWRSRCRFPRADARPGAGRGVAKRHPRPSLIGTQGGFTVSRDPPLRRDALLTNMCSCRSRGLLCAVSEGTRHRQPHSRPRRRRTTPEDQPRRCAASLRPLPRRSLPLRGGGDPLARAALPRTAGRTWVRWHFHWHQPAVGRFELLACATDRRGFTQPDSVPFNDGGYLFWAVVRHPVTVGA